MDCDSYLEQDSGDSYDSPHLIANSWWTMLATLLWQRVTTTTTTYWV